MPWSAYSGRGESHISTYLVIYHFRSHKARHESALGYKLGKHVGFECALVDASQRRDSY